MFKFQIRVSHLDRCIARSLLLFPIRQVALSRGNDHREVLDPPLPQLFSKHSTTSNNRVETHRLNCSIAIRLLFYAMCTRSCSPLIKRVYFRCHCESIRSESYFSSNGSESAVSKNQKLVFHKITFYLIHLSGININNVSSCSLMSLKL